MYEYVFSAFTLDETKTFFCIKPFNCTLFHNCCLLVWDIHTMCYYPCSNTLDENQNLFQSEKEQK